MAKLTYSVFVDVLGYGAIVTDKTKTTDQKINILNSIYSNLASGLLITINEINQVINDKIYIKSFSDSFYLESTNLLALIYSCNRIFNDTFGFYTNMPKDSEYTPLIRGGMVKDWTVRFNDLGAIVNNHQGTNPVGLGVARAYWTSEKTKLSGMRLIISEEVVDDLDLKKYSKNGFDCFIQEFTYNNMPTYLFFDKIEKNEDDCPVNLYELIWSEPVMSSCTYEYNEQLKNIRNNFNAKSLRHFKKTAEIILKGLLTTDCNDRTQNVFENKKDELIKMME
jgi:hypothetical protein